MERDEALRGLLYDLLIDTEQLRRFAHRLPGGAQLIREVPERLAYNAQLHRLVELLVARDQVDDAFFETLLGFGPMGESVRERIRRLREDWAGLDAGASGTRAPASAAGSGGIHFHAPVSFNNSQVGEGPMTQYNSGEAPSREGATDAARQAEPTSQGQQVHNHGPVGQQVNVAGDATLNLGGPEEG